MELLVGMNINLRNLGDHACCYTKKTSKKKYVSFLIYFPLYAFCLCETFKILLLSNFDKIPLYMIIKGEYREIKESEKWF